MGLWTWLFQDGKKKRRKGVAAIIPHWRRKNGVFTKARRGKYDSDRQPRVAGGRSDGGKFGGKGK